MTLSGPGAGSGSDGADVEARLPVGAEPTVPEDGVAAGAVPEAAGNGAVTGAFARGSGAVDAVAVRDVAGAGVREAVAVGLGAGETVALGSGVGAGVGRAVGEGAGLGVGCVRGGGSPSTTGPWALPVGVGVGSRKSGTANAAPGTAIAMAERLAVSARVARWRDFG